MADVELFILFVEFNIYFLQFLCRSFFFLYYVLSEYKKQWNDLEMKCVKDLDSCFILFWNNLE